MASNVPWLRFDRREWAGAWGDIGTDLPVIIGLVAVSGLDAACVCIMFGLSQILTGLRYGIPMPVQPLKAMAAIVLSRRLAPEVLTGGGLVVGAAMLLLAVTGGLDKLARHLPEAAVRGMQLGLSLTLAGTALGTYIGSAPLQGRLLAAGCALGLGLWRRGVRVPGPGWVMLAGAVFGLFCTPHVPANGAWFAWRLPQFAVPSLDAVAQGAMLLALPQLALSLANSVLATAGLAHDLFPERPVTVRRIGVTYGLMNLLVPWWGGVPVCHGCGGLAGFYGFGARTGGAPVIYGAGFLVLGLGLSPAFFAVARLFPLPVLGVVLLFEALGLGLVAHRKTPVGKGPVAWLVATTVVWLPHGWLAGMLLGWALDRLWEVRLQSTIGLARVR